MHTKDSSLPADGVFRDIVETTPDAIAIQAGDRIVYANPSMATLLAASDSAALIGRDVLEFATPASRPRIEEGIERIRSGHGDGAELVQMVALDGSLRDVLLSSIPVHVNGTRGLAIIVRDVAARVAAERSARESQERFDLLARATNDAVWDWDLATDIVTWNRSLRILFGWDVDRSPLSWWSDRIHDDDRERVAGTLRRAVDTEDVSWSDKYRFLRADGAIAWILDRGYLVRDQSGRAVRMIGSMTDVSELHRAHEERTSLQTMLEQANRVASLGRVASTIAHEFNNVLMAIQPYAEILRRRSGELPEVERPASQILQAVKRGKRVTDELVRFTRPALPTIKPVRLQDLLKRLAELTHDLNLPDIEVRVESPAEEITIAGDAAQLEQVAMNLIFNARDAMPSGGTLTLTASRSANTDVAFLSAEELATYACLSISDTGEGIAPEIVDRIFEPLFTTKPRGGTGLGLAVAQQTITRHNGYLLVSSEVGRGATFHILLPKVVC
jgi:PAS domain S-box-containing protein